MVDKPDISHFDKRYGSLDSFREQAMGNCVAANVSHCFGVLVEGVDYSGKTSACSVVERILQSKGMTPTRNACFLYDHPIIRRLLALAKTSDDMVFRDTCYTASLLLDLSLTDPLCLGGFRIQERHVLTQIGRNSYFYDDQENWQIDTMRRMRPLFSHQIYLTSNIEAKNSRTRSRRPKSPRDALLAADPGLHQHYDDAMRVSLPPGENWHVIDTSDLTIDQVAQAILKHLDTFQNPFLDRLIESASGRTN